MDRLHIGPVGIIGTSIALSGGDEEFLRQLMACALRPPGSSRKIWSLRSVVLSDSSTVYMVGLTRYSETTVDRSRSVPSQTITFFSNLLDELSAPATLGVMAHELAHVWLNEHVRPEESHGREKEADDLARAWGFAEELDALDNEADTVN